MSTCTFLLLLFCKLQGWDLPETSSGDVREIVQKIVFAEKGTVRTKYMENLVRFKCVRFLVFFQYETFQMEFKKS